MMKKERTENITVSVLSFIKLTVSSLFSAYNGVIRI